MNYQKKVQRLFTHSSPIHRQIPPKILQASTSQTSKSHVIPHPKKHAYVPRHRANQSHSKRKHQNPIYPSRAGALINTEPTSLPHAHTHTHASYPSGNGNNNTTATILHANPLISADEGFCVSLSPSRVPRERHALGAPSRLIHITAHPSDALDTLALVCREK